MKVTLIGWTAMALPERVAGSNLHAREGNYFRDFINTTEADMMAELAGRTCYDSYHLPNPSTATNEFYLANIILQQHFSVLEHASATFFVQDVSRNLLLELTRHRHLSFSVRSTRYVDESGASIVIPPALHSLLQHDVAPVDDEGWTVSDELEAVMDHALAVYKTLIELLLSEGMSRKQAREAAREVLPGATRTEFIVTANHRAWREMLQKRIAPGAAAEIRLFAAELLSQLKQIAPNTYQDL